MPPSGAERSSHWKLWPFAPALGAARWVLGGAGGPQPRACGCLWGEVSSLWGSRSGQLLGTPHVHPPTLILALLPGFGGACGTFPGHIHPTASHVAPAASLASGRAQGYPGAAVGAGATSWHLGCGGDELQRGGKGGSSDLPRPGNGAELGQTLLGGRQLQSLVPATLALCKCSSLGLLRTGWQWARDASLMPGKTPLSLYL